MSVVVYSCAHWHIVHGSMQHVPFWIHVYIRSWFVTFICKGLFLIRLIRWISIIHKRYICLHLFSRFFSSIVRIINHFPEKSVFYLKISLPQISISGQYSQDKRALLNSGELVTKPQERFSPLTCLFYMRSFSFARICQSVRVGPRSLTVSKNRNSILCRWAST